MDPTVAYFCMEYGLHEEFPNYAGGLGILAGDFIRSGRALGLPVVGVGLRWLHGYSRQRILPDGQPVDDFPTYRADFLEDTGVRVRVRIASREVEARVWRTERWGNAPLFLLEPVAGDDAWITRRLYEPTLDCRVAQEILLGVGGIRALRKLWLDVTGACEIIPITNGVHRPTWQDARIREALGSATGLRATHEALKQEMLAAVAQRTGVRLDANVLTIGFARRAAGYKRSDLVFGDPARIEPLLAAGRLQLVFAGKAHPDDAGGRRIVANLVAMARRYSDRVVFVPDYDMGLARLLTRGADVW